MPDTKKPVCRAAANRMTKKRLHIKRQLAKDSEETLAENFFKHEVLTEYRDGWRNRVFKRDPTIIEDKMVCEHTKGMVTTFEFEDGSIMSVFNNQTGQQITV